MAKTKCVICKACNVRADMRKHVSLDNLVRFRQLLDLIRERDPEAIATICETHRNPLELNTVVIDLFSSAKQVAESLRTGTPLSVIGRF